MRHSVMCTYNKICHIDAGPLFINRVQNSGLVREKLEGFWPRNRNWGLHPQFHIMYLFEIPDGVFKFAFISKKKPFNFLCAVLPAHVHLFAYFE